MSSNSLKVTKSLNSKEHENWNNNKNLIENSPSLHFTDQLPQANKQRVVHDKHPKGTHHVEF